MWCVSVCYYGIYMDSVMSLFILAVVQGLTEFLPISSSAHLILFSDLLGDGVPDALGIVIILHAATLFASLVYFRKDIRCFVVGFFSRTTSADRSEAYAVLLGTLPIAFVGFLVYPMFLSLQTVSVVAVALVVSGSLLIFADYTTRRQWASAAHAPMWRKGLGIGMMQIFGLLPGVSRSGVTIAGGRLFGFSRRQAARFSFLLAIPTIVGALVLLLAQSSLSDLSFGGVGVGVLLLTACVSGGIAYVTIHVFLRFVERVGFVPFFGYQVLLGIVLLLLSVV